MTNNNFKSGAKQSIYNLLNVYQPYPKLITEHRNAINAALEAITKLHEAECNKRVAEASKKYFLEGFKVSGEGWNGEYPHEGETDESIWRNIEYRYLELKQNNLKRRK